MSVDNTAEINVPNKFKVKQMEVMLTAIPFAITKIDINLQCSVVQTKWVIFSTKGVEIGKEEAMKLCRLADVSPLQLEMDKHSLAFLVNASDEEALLEDFSYKGKKV